MGSTNINYPAENDDYQLWLKYQDQSFSLELNDEEAMVIVSCETVADWNKTFNTSVDEKKSNLMVQAIAELLEREGKQLAEIYKQMEKEQDTSDCKCH